MNYIIWMTCVLVVQTHAGILNNKSKLSWKHLTRENFTEQHNWELIKGFLENPDEKQRVRPTQNATDITLDETIFTLYTRSGPTTGVRVIIGDDSIFEGQFDHKKPTVIAAHGFLSRGNSGWMLDLKNAQLSVQDVNYITIDWNYCAGNTWYPSAVDCTKKVGKYLADVIQFLGQHGAEIQAMHLMGHSLGAHVVAQVSNYEHRVGRITGFDPAGPFFDSDDLPARIDPGDAKVVDVIHTNCDMFGYDGVLGHYDFFPNGGGRQPGCFLLDYLCDHSKSYLYYTDSLYNNKKYPAQRCDSLDDAETRECSGVKNYMGVLSTEGPKGIFYLKVDDPKMRNSLVALYQQIFLIVRALAIPTTIMAISFIFMPTIIQRHAFINRKELCENKY